jgi:serine/threonine-protein phosphatase 6 regulatory ankyrin repeat subunit B
LISATGSGHLTTVQALLCVSGININAQNFEGSTALLVAALNSNYDLVKTLINHGANVNVASNIRCTPLMIAAEKGDLTTVQALLGAPEIDINAQNDGGFTALYVAGFYGNYDVVKTLINHGASVNLADNNRWTPLMIAAEKGDLTTVQALLGVSGININAQNSEGSTALLVAALNGNYGVVKALIKQGADVDITDNNGQTPIMVASSLGYMTIVQAFFDRY